jgi:hypothetical protein
MDNRFSLDKSSKKHLCPQCNKKRFVFYIDTETNDYLPAIYGRCDRLDNCSYHLNPYKDNYLKDNTTDHKEPKDWKPKQKLKTVYFDLETFKQTLKPERYEINTFIQNLLKNVKYPFDIEDINKVIELYYLGTVANGYRVGANTFPFIDKDGKIRAVQVKQFDEQNHTTGTDFLHSIIEKHHNQNKTALPAWLQDYNKNESKVSCLFGEHLLSKYPNNPIALVEAPKTAIYGTLYLGPPTHPKNFIWLAVYNKSSFSFDKLKVLKGRDVFVFPDLSKDGNTFKEWETKAKEYQKLLSGTRFIFSDLLERLASTEQKDKGADIADILIQHDWRVYRNKTETEQLPTPEPLKASPKVGPNKSINIVDPFEPYDYVEPEIPEYENWEKNITELEDYFERATPPTQPVKLNHWSTIIDYSLFIKSHLTIIKANNGKKTCIPYLNRLQEFKTLSQLGYGK